MKANVFTPKNGQFVAVILSENATNKGFRNLENVKEGQREIFFVIKSIRKINKKGTTLYGQFIFEFAKRPDLAFRLDYQYSDYIGYTGTEHDDRIRSIDPLTESEKQLLKARLRCMAIINPEYEKKVNYLLSKVD